MKRTVTFKDKTIYSKMAYSCAHRLLYETETHKAVEIELIDKDSSYHIQMPFEHELKQMEANNDVQSLAFWAKYRKWQKRKLYTIEEFNQHLTIDQ